MKRISLNKKHVIIYKHVSFILETAPSTLDTSVYYCKIDCKGLVLFFDRYLRYVNPKKNNFIKTCKLMFI